MKLKALYIFSIVLAIAFVSCKKQDDLLSNAIAIGVGSPSPTTRVALDTLCSTTTFSLDILSGELSPIESPAEPTTRADNSFASSNIIPDGQSFGVFASCHNADWDGTTTANFFYDTEVTRNGTDYRYSPTRYWTSQDKVSFFAYYPFHATGAILKKDNANYTASTAGFPNVIDFTVQDDVAQQVDLLYSPILNDRTSGVVNFNFKHALTQVNFSARLNAYGASITIKKITLSGMKCKGVFNLDTEKWTCSDDEKSYSITPNLVFTDTIASDITTDIATFLVVPHTLSADAKITLEYIDDAGVDQTKEISLAGKEWKSNSAVNYVLSINGTHPDIINTGSVYEIYTARGLKAFEQLVNGNATPIPGLLVKGLVEFGAAQNNINGKLMNNIDLNNEPWSPMVAYSGKFDGNNKTVSNFNVDMPAGANCGFFAFTTLDCEVKNMTLMGKVVANMVVGGFVGHAQGNSKFINCVNKCIINGGENVGGIAGACMGIVENCTNDATVTASGNTVGGVVGFAQDNSSVINSENHAGANVTSSTGGSVGGVVGYAGTSVRIVSCSNSSAVLAKANVGGVLGCASLGVQVSECTNNARVEGTSDNVAGIVGLLSTFCSVKNCVNNGTVKGPIDIGGIAGFAQSRSTVDGCRNNAAVEGKENVGGIAGIVAGNSTVSNSTNSANVSSSVGGIGGVGGIAGYVQTSCTISNCKNLNASSKIICYAGSNVVGGIVGTLSGTVVNCMNNAKIECGGTYGAGVVGICYSGGLIQACYNQGAVSGKENIAGIVGEARNADETGTEGSKAFIVACYNTAALAATGTNVGGIAAVITKGVSINSCYNKGALTNSSGDKSSRGGIVGFSTSTEASKNNFYTNTNCNTVVGSYSGNINNNVTAMNNGITTWNNNNNPDCPFKYNASAVLVAN